MAMLVSGGVEAKFSNILYKLFVHIWCTIKN